MKIIKVTYTDKANFSDQKQQNLKKVMADLTNLNHQATNYNACLSADNKTFVHPAFFKADEDQKILNDLGSFKIFQVSFKPGGYEVLPKQEFFH